MIKPFSNRIVVRPENAEARTTGGIFIPQQVQDKELPKVGTIVSAGPGEYDETGKIIPVQVNAGDRVLFNSYAGTEIQDDGEKLILLRETDLIGLLE